MLVMTFTGVNGENCEVLAHVFYKNLHTVEDLTTSEYARKEYKALEAAKKNPHIYQLVEMPPEQIREAMEQEAYQAMPLEQRKKWLLQELCKLEGLKSY